jgi:hypothetical protein
LFVKRIRFNEDGPVTIAGQHYGDPKMFKLIIPLALLAVPTFAAADGYEGSAKDGGYAARPAAIYAYQVRPSRLAVRCPAEILRRWPNIKDKECARISAVNDRRSGGARRIRYDRPERRVVEREVYTIRDADRRGICQGAVSATSEERGSQDRALKSLEAQWRTAVSDAFGFRYVGIGDARGYYPRCGIIRKNKLGWPIWVCRVSARPCR